tara:strand:+ start:647 stop:763 length:117 start_codon:yes stop_codon:yes gene_type:complete
MPSDSNLAAIKYAFTVNQAADKVLKILDADTVQRDLRR